MPRRVERDDGKSPLDERVDESKEPRRVAAPAVDEKDRRPFAERPGRQEPLSESFAPENATGERLHLPRETWIPGRRAEEPLRANRREAGQQRGDRCESGAQHLQHRTLPCMARKPE